MFKCLYAKEVWTRAALPMDFQSAYSIRSPRGQQAFAHTNQIARSHGHLPHPKNRRMWYSNKFYFRSVAGAYPVRSFTDTRQRTATAWYANSRLLLPSNANHDRLARHLIVHLLQVSTEGIEVNGGCCYGGHVSRKAEDLSVGRQQSSAKHGRTGCASLV